MAPKYMQWTILTIVCSFMENSIGLTRVNISNIIYSHINAKSLIILTILSI